jgi:hypothetical protein
MARSRRRAGHAGKRHSAQGLVWWRARYGARLHAYGRHAEEHGRGRTRPRFHSREARPARRPPANLIGLRYRFIEAGLTTFAKATVVRRSFSGGGKACATVPPCRFRMSRYDGASRQDRPTGRRDRARLIRASRLRPARTGCRARCWRGCGLSRGQSLS